MGISHSKKLEPGGGIFASHAATYARLGWSVLPVVGGQKIPIGGTNGVHSATRDLDQIAAWAERYPRANIGIACGGEQRLIVVDVDPRHGGHITMSQLAAEEEPFPVCPEAVTGNNGRHLILALPANKSISVFKLGAGVDIKSSGGYIVAAPSRTGPSEAGPGGVYRWLPERDPWLTEVPELPEWAIRRLQVPKRNVVPIARSFSPSIARRRLDGLADAVANAPLGSRNVLLNWAAYQAATELIGDAGLDAATVEHVLTTAALSAGLPVQEINRTIASAFRAAFEKGSAAR
jgi:Bifunctional DNA primase/polymerase, N-terminal